MFLEIPTVLTPAEVTFLQTVAARAKFVDGRITSPNSEVKRNQQIDQASQDYAESSRLMAAALQRCEEFVRFAYPRKLAPPMLARYQPGMAYGAHSDAAFLPLPTGPLRSDVSCTLFLTAPGDYDGGALAIHLGTRMVEFRGLPGSAVAYPSNTLHEVTPVTRGERLVGLTFVESEIADPAQRDMLYHLDEVAALEGLKMTWENRMRLQHVRNNLRRVWGSAP